MKQIFEMKDEKNIKEFLDSAEYGALAICADNKPYSLPLNFVKIGNSFYFHGAKRGKKMEIIKQNMQASFSVVQAYSIIQSYFSSKDKLACPATQFFKSVIADGVILFVEKKDEKVMALTALMEKLQPEGDYRALSEDIYSKMLDATMVYKLEVQQLQAKFKFGQHLSRERFEMIIEHLATRGDDMDDVTIKTMKELKNGV